MLFRSRNRSAQTGKRYDYGGKEYLKKSSRHIFNNLQMKFLFIANHSVEFTISGMCRALEVERLSYYAWAIRPESKRLLEDRLLIQRIKELHTLSKKRYGYPKIHVELQKQGVSCGHNRIARLMRQEGIKSKIMKKYKHKGKSVGEDRKSTRLNSSH